jgi:coenzyme PQQ precursor peptide PqqA
MRTIAKTTPKIGWKKPKVREIPCGYEINAYASAERPRD